MIGPATPMRTEPSGSVPAAAKLDSGAVPIRAATPAAATTAAMARRRPTPLVVPSPITDFPLVRAGIANRSRFMITVVSVLTRFDPQIAEAHV